MPPEVRAACPSEAGRIHALLREAFADTVLPFTIYRTRQSASRLADLAREGRVRVVGDVEAVSIGSGKHLDYLAVAQAARGRGIGRLLMEDFHAARHEATLDVLANNPALAWYESLGYKRVSEGQNVRIAPKFTGRAPDDWSVALLEERTKGFAAVDHAGLRIGLLGGDALRLLDAGGRSTEEAIAILRSIGFGGRSEIVMMGLTTQPEGYECIQSVTSVRMRRVG